MPREEDRSTHLSHFLDVFLVHVCLERRTSADKITVPINIVNAPTGRPELVRPEPGSRVSSYITRIWSIPLLTHDIIHGVRCVSQRRVFNLHSSTSNIINLGTNCKHCITETVKLSKVLTFGRFDHQCSSNRPRHCRRMEPIILKTLSNIFFCYPSGCFQWPQVKNEFMGTLSVLSSEKYVICTIQTSCHVVSIQNCVLGCLFKTCSAIHLDVHP
mmetsp:Transcript_10937/g.16407  ORF Transcript_10937/g.16407 Transcript_10937/m.16407 type:complete len:215 (-) Transcript_10937:2302-2946(-)